MATRKKSSTPSSPIVAWRTERLIAAGIPARTAREIAEDCSYDLHALLSLVDRGCPPELALRIIAPLDDSNRPC